MHLLSTKQKFEDIEDVKKALKEHGIYAVIVTKHKRYCVAETTTVDSKVKDLNDGKSMSFDYLMILEDRTDILGVVSNLLFSQIVSIEPMNREESIWVYEFLEEKEISLREELCTISTFRDRLRTKVEKIENDESRISPYLNCI